MEYSKYLVNVCRVLNECKIYRIYNVWKSKYGIYNNKFIIIII